MFGYIKANLPMLDDEDRQVYKSTYCSLCRALGKSYGFFTKFILNYDLTFLALVKLALSDRELKKEFVFCPFKCKKCSVFSDEEIFRQIACVSILLTYAKIKDNLSDEKGFKKMLSIVIYPYFFLKYRKARREYPELEKIVMPVIPLQKKAESGYTCIDELAHPTADALGNLFSFGCTDDNIYKLGYFIGRWVYFTDAADDRAEDKNNGRFNPFLNEEFTDERILDVLNFSLSEAICAFDEITVKRYKKIIENILLIGTGCVQNSIVKR